MTAKVVKEMVTSGREEGENQDDRRKGKQEKENMKKYYLEMYTLVSEEEPEKELTRV